MTAQEFIREKRALETKRDTALARNDTTAIALAIRQLRELQHITPTERRR